VVGVKCTTFKCHESICHCGRGIVDDSPDLAREEGIRCAKSDGPEVIETNMRIPVVILLLTIARGDVFAQVDLPKYLRKLPSDLHRWEQTLPQETKEKMISLLPDDIRNPPFEPTEYHFLDFTGDHEPDLICVVSLWSSSGTSWFRNTDTGLVKLWNAVGTAHDMQQSPGDSSLRFYVLDSPGGDDGRFFLDEIKCASCNGLIQFRLVDEFLWDMNTPMPKAFWDTSVAFRVANEGYMLRLAPKIDNRGYQDIWGPVTGNILAVYPKGSTGVAFGEETDASGRRWWFVSMSNTRAPVHTRYMTEGHNGKCPQHLVGWMSSRYLELSKPSSP